ncbi:hypothetical protein D3C73_1093030 [compost metagenome]
MLHCDGIRAFLSSSKSFLHTGDTGDDLAAGFLKGPDHRLSREAKREAYKLHRVGQQGVDLVLPRIIVIKPKGRQGHAVAGCLRFKFGPVRLQMRPGLRARRELTWVRYEHVHAKRNVECPRGSDFGSHGFGALVTGGDETQPATLMNCLHQRRCRRSPGHGSCNKRCTKQGFRHVRFLLRTLQASLSR